MNNKKLFKGALVLFASILMAVSCSAGDKTGGDGNGGGGSTGGDGTGGDKVTTITDAQIQKALQDAFGSTELNLESGGQTKADFSKGTYANGTFSVTGTKKTNDPSRGQLDTLVKTDKKDNIIAELDKIGLVAKGVESFASSGTGDTATGTFNITVKSNYEIQNTVKTITISVKVDTATWQA